MCHFTIELNWVSLKTPDWILLWFMWDTILLSQLNTLFYYAHDSSEVCLHESNSVGQAKWHKMQSQEACKYPWVICQRIVAVRALVHSSNKNNSIQIVNHSQRFMPSFQCLKRVDALHVAHFNPTGKKDKNCQTGSHRITLGRKLCSYCI